MRRLLLSGLVVVLAAGGLAAVGAPGTSVRTIPAGDIVFTRLMSKPDRQDLYVMAADGSHPRLLVRNAGNATVSPDGRRIAFVRAGGIWVMRRDGSKQRVLTGPSAQSTKNFPYYGSDDDPAWSPTGATLYFSHWTDAFGTNAIFSIRKDGTHRVRLTRPEGGECNVGTSPSPDGRLIVFMHFSMCARWEEVFLVAVTNSGRPARLSFAFPSGGNPYDPAWSPDGRQLAYGFVDWVSLNGGGTGASGVYVSRSDRSRPHRIAGGFQYAYDPAWSPDSKWIAFDGPGGVSLVRSDGTSLQSLSAWGSNPAWLP